MENRGKTMLATRLPQYRVKVTVRLSPDAKGRMKTAILEADRPDIADALWDIFIAWALFMEDWPKRNPVVMRGNDPVRYYDMLEREMCAVARQWAGAFLSCPIDRTCQHLEPMVPGPSGLVCPTCKAPADTCPKCGKPVKPGGEGPCFTCRLGETVIDKLHYRPADIQ